MFQVNWSTLKSGSASTAACLSARRRNRSWSRHWHSNRCLAHLTRPAAVQRQRSDNCERILDNGGFRELFLRFGVVPTLTLSLSLSAVQWKSTMLLFVYCCCFFVVDNYLLPGNRSPGNTMTWGEVLQAGCLVLGGKIPKNFITMPCDVLPEEVQDLLKA